MSEWSGRPDLNRGPPAPKAGALPGCATPRHLLCINSTALLDFPLIGPGPLNKLAGNPKARSHSLWIRYIAQIQKNGLRSYASMPLPGCLFVEPGLQSEKLPTNNGCVHTFHSRWLFPGRHRYSFLLASYSVFLEGFVSCRFTRKSLPARFRKPTKLYPVPRTAQGATSSAAARRN